MYRVGDRIQVTISGGAAGQQLHGGQASIGLGAGASMSVPGTIVGDGGSFWIVELGISVGGANRINVPKY